MAWGNSIAIVGSRTYPYHKDKFEALDDAEKEEAQQLGRKYVHAFMDNLQGGDLLTIVSGGAKGPDTWAAEYARDAGFRVIEILPNWKKYGGGAGFKRNKDIVLAANEVVAFWDLTSNGTHDTMKKAAEYSRPLIVFGPDGKLLMYANEGDYAKDEAPLLALPKG